MDAPKCRLCQERHYGLCSFTAKPIPALKPPSLSHTKATAMSTAPIAKRTRAPNGTFDRKAYQRDLMRQRRAKIAKK